MPTELDDLVQQAEEMMADIQGDSDLPRIARSLDQMRQQGDRLYTRGAHSDVKAARLLGSKAGFELPSSLAQKLEFIETSTTIDGIEDLTPDTDIQTFLKKEREMILLSAIEQTRRSTFEESDSRSELAIQQWWEQEKQKILTTLAGGSSGSGPDLPELQSIIGQEYMEMSAAGDKLSVPSRTALTQTELHYARQVDKFLNNQDVELSELLSSSYISSAASSMCGTVNDELICDPDIAEFWHHIIKFSAMPRRVSSSGGGAISGESTGIQVMHSRNEAWLQKQGVRCAIEELELEMFSLMRSAVEAAPNEAQLGGRPGILPLVKAFLKIRLGSNTALYSSLEDGTIENRPVWPMIYYCMRCGDFSKALEIAKKAVGNLGKFPVYLEYYVANDRSLSHNYRMEMRHTYKRSVRHGTDPFKRLVYCMIGSCDPSDNHSEVASSIMDFLWVKLHQLNWDDHSQKSSVSADVPLSDDVLTLAQLQKLLFEDYGETHFEAWRQPLLFFKILFLTQQFEAALAFLSRFEQLRCHAVHAALTLKQNNLLILSKSVQEQLLSREASDPDGIRRLNLARLIMIYTRKFEVTDTRDALNYFYFLNDLQLGEENVFFKCIAELVIETREFDLILGYVDDSGRKHPGALNRFKLDTAKLISHVAEMLENRGLVLEASRLFELGGDMDRSIGLTNQVLAAKITQPSDFYERIQIVDRATKLGLCLRQQSSYTPSTNAKGLFFLLDLCSFFDLVEAADFESALSVMDSLRLLPTRNDSENVNSRIRTFSQLPEEIRRIMPHILLATMRCMKARMQLTRPELNATVGGRAQSSQVKEVLERAKSLVTFAGRLPYRMPGEVYVKLSQMEMEMV